MYNPLEEIRSYMNNMGAYEVEFTDGTIISCKTPGECVEGIIRISELMHSENPPKVYNVRVPSNGGTESWRNNK